MRIVSPIAGFAQLRFPLNSRLGVPGRGYESPSWQRAHFVSYPWPAVRVPYGLKVGKRKRKDSEPFNALIHGAYPDLGYSGIAV